MLVEELGRLKTWLSDNRLLLHLSKTESVLFGSKPRLKKESTLDIKIEGVFITSKSSVSYLGCILDGNLRGGSMALKVLGKVNARTRYLARRARLLDRESLKLLACCLVQCHLDYAVSLWYWGLNKGLKQKLQVAQNKLVRVVLGLDYRSVSSFSSNGVQLRTERARYNLTWSIGS